MTKSQSPKMHMKRLRAFCAYAKKQDFGPPLNFYSITLPDGKVIVENKKYPPIDTPWALDFFFLAMVHNYGFWYGDKNYEKPLVGNVDGKPLKGSDLLWTLFLRAFTKDHNRLTGQMVLNLTQSDWCRIMSDDDGPVPLLTTPERLHLTHDLARTLGKNASGKTGGQFIRHATTHSSIPARVILDALTHPTRGIAGYCEDPLKKKAMLLLMALANRPERFVVPETGFAWLPVIDYHIMRVLVRLGLVVLPKGWQVENIERRATSPLRESLIRRACYDCVKWMIMLSGCTMADLDQLLWMARRYCPEVGEPNCAACVLQTVCTKKTAFFQPVLRTTHY